MFRYFVELSYLGTAYCGWQRQLDSPSVQQTIEEVFALILRQNISLLGCGRTDTGVHAHQFFAHFDMLSPLENDFDLARLVQKFNHILPKDIAIQRIFPATSQAHARFDAVYRKYHYHLSLQKNPFLIGQTKQVFVDLDFEKMNQAAALLLQYEDFQAFSKVDTQVKHFRCKIFASYFEKQEQDWIYVIAANRFLRNMVRAIMGTLYRVGSGKCTLEDFQRIIEGKKRADAGDSIQAQGLSLVEVRYKEGIFL